MMIRLHKYLADHGVASRRKCEEYIKQGLIKVNGKVVTEMGIKIDPEFDKIETSPKLKLQQQEFVYYAFHKPAGYVCTVTGHEKPKITELLGGIKERVFPVGRLDKLTSGLLFLTNNGQFAYKLTHPKFEKEKEYVVKVREKLTPAIIKKLGQSFFIRGKKTAGADIKIQNPHIFRVILHEGKNRQIRRMCQRANLHIEKLKRIRIANFLLGELKPKEFRKLSYAEISELLGFI